MTNNPTGSFRDRISTVDEKGKRVWVYPKKPKGPLLRARTWVGVALLAFLFGGPFIRIGGEPMLLLNIAERKFIIFGNIFWPQDFHLFVFAMLLAIVFIALFTVIFGRLFCGWICPQTIFMEMVFRKVEYWIEGDFKHQRALDKQPWNAEKIRKKGLKHLVFFAIAFLVSNTFLAYIIGVEELCKIVSEPISAHWGGFTAMMVFSGTFYAVFARMREQVCTTICPYGRMQGVLLDRNSIVVAYDYIRGEGRGKFRKNEDRKAAGKGDCIDCGHCVDVCPTGIDIRNGTQLECVNCTACIDACNSIMKAVNLKKGLIRYDSEAGIAEGKKFAFTPRVIGYISVLTALLVVLGALLFSRSDTETTILRTPGMMYQKNDDGTLSNLYNFKVVNKTNKDFPLRFELENLKGEIAVVGDTLSAKKQQVSEGVMFIKIEKSVLGGMKNEVEIGVYSGDERIETIETTFLGPA